MLLLWARWKQLTVCRGETVTVARSPICQPQECVTKQHTQYGGGGLQGSKAGGNPAPTSVKSYNRTDYGPLQQCQEQPAGFVTEVLALFTFHPTILASWTSWANERPTQGIPKLLATLPFNSGSLSFVKGHKTRNVWTWGMGVQLFYKLYQWMKSRFH